VEDAEADGYLTINYDQLECFVNERCIADFFLNIANPLTTDYLKQCFNLEILTASYD
jgi:putative protease